MQIVRAAIRLIVGAAFGVLSFIALSPAIAAFIPTQPGGAPAFALLAMTAIGAALGFFAPTIRRAFGRGFLLAGVSVFALPLSAVMLSGRVANDMIATSANANEQAGAALGAGIAGVALAGASAFIGFILGTILIVIGLALVLGGRREVVIVERQARVEPR